MMIPNWLVLCGVALGHASVSVLIVNVVFGLGFPEHAMKRVGWATIAALGVLSLVLVFLTFFAPFLSWPAVFRDYGFLCLAVGLIGLPVSTLLRALRRQPVGVVNSGSSVLFADDISADSIPTGNGPRAWWLGIPGNESLSLRSRQWQVEIPSLPKALDGLSILHISDLHFSNAYDRRYFERVAESASGIEADLVLFTGDLIDSHDAIDWIVPILSRIRGRIGQFAILGNHDFAQDFRSIYRSVRRAGFPVLEGRWTRLEIDGSTLALGGTSAPWGRRIDRHPIPEADVHILMSHTPDRLFEAASLGIDLVLSGHNHGGQVRLPVIGPILMPSRYSRRFDLGFFRSGKTLLHVSPGIGAKHPLRIRCPPEISRIVLRARGRIDDPLADRAILAFEGSKSVAGNGSD